MAASRAPVRATRTTIGGHRRNCGRSVVDNLPALQYAHVLELDLSEEEMESLNSRNRPPRIDTSHSHNTQPVTGTGAWYAVEQPLLSPASPRTSALPSFRISSSPNNEKQPLAPPIGKTTNKARNESRKLLAHVLGQLQNRPLPPPIFEAFSSNGDETNDHRLGAILETVKGAVNFKAGTRDANRDPHVPVPVTEDDSDDEVDRTFSTGATLDLMMQLRDVLTISVAQGWQIFDDR